MSGKQARILWCLVCLPILAAIAGSFQEGRAQPEAVRGHVKPESVLGKNTFLYLHYDGSGGHATAWQKTAAHDAFVKAGIRDMLQKIGDVVTNQVGNAGDPRLNAVLENLSVEGFTMALTLPANEGPPIPSATFILPGSGDTAEALKLTLENFDVLDPVREIRGRTVYRTLIPDSPGVEVAFWAEKSDLIISLGIDSIQQTLSVLDGDAPNLSESPTWKSANRDSVDPDVDITSICWFDWSVLKDRFGEMPLPIPTPDPVTISRIMEVTGLSGLEAVYARGGYRGAALWSDVRVAMSQQSSGFMSLLNQRMIEWDDLPPLPAESFSFHAGTFAVDQAFDSLLTMVRGLAAMESPRSAAFVDNALDQVNQQLGIDLREDLLGSFGDVFAIYDDPGQSLFGEAGALVIQLKDSEKAKRSVQSVLRLVEKLSGGDFRVLENRPKDETLLTFEIANRVEAGAIAFEEDWMVISLLPQAISAFRMRQSGELPRWSWAQMERSDVRLSGLATGAGRIPEEFTSVTVSDPRPGYRGLAKLMPLFLTVGVAAIKESGFFPENLRFPVTLADVPPAERVTKSLFPNVAFSTAKAGELRWTTEQSLPSIPFVSGASGGSGIASVGVMTALVLPAVQAARSAARRSQSANNLKQIGLALHNYHDVYGFFPQASLPNDKLKPAKRFSWMVSILPFIEEANLYQSLNREAAWDARENQLLVATPVTVFINPQMSVTESDYAPTHYAGISGLGKDAADLPVNSPKAGMFGNNRKTRFRDVLDGTSNTVMVSAVQTGVGPWAQSGRSTIRSLTAEPVINGPDGFGSTSPEGCMMGLADGSVRFISENIDPSILKAMFTIRGGERIPNDF